MAKSKKITVDHPHYESRSEVDNALSQIAVMQAEIDGATAKYNEEEQLRRAQLAEFVGPRAIEIQRIEMGLIEWATNNRHEFPANKKTLELTHGNLIFRLSPPKVSALPKFTMASALEMIKRAGLSYVRVKEEIDKDSILTDYAADKLNDNALAAVGLQVTQEEDIRYEIKNAASSEVVNA